MNGLASTVTLSALQLPSKLPGLDEFLPKPFINNPVFGMNRII